MLARRAPAHDAAAGRRLHHEAAGRRAAAGALADCGREPDQCRGDRRRLADVCADWGDAGAQWRCTRALTAVSIPRTPPPDLPEINCGSPPPGGTPPWAPLPAPRQFWHL